MPRPQFSLKTLLWLMALVGVCLAAWQALKPPYRIVWNPTEREYVWRNGLAITVSQDGIKIETGVDVSAWRAKSLSRAHAHGRRETTLNYSPH
jgi:hypothetical protein